MQIRFQMLNLCKPEIITEELKENYYSDSGSGRVYVNMCICSVWEGEGLMANVYVGCLLVYVAHTVVLYSFQLVKNGVARV